METFIRTPRPERPSPPPLSDQDKLEELLFEQREAANSAFITSTLTTYLASPSTHLHLTAVALTSYLNTLWAPSLGTTREDQGHHGLSYLEDQGHHALSYLEDLWNAILTHAQSTHYRSPTHTAIVSLFLEIRKQEPPFDPDGKMNAMVREYCLGNEFWRDLPVWENTVYMLYQPRMGPEDNYSDHRCTGTAWASVQVLRARIGTGPSTDRHAVFVMADTLEEMEPSEVRLEGYLEGAAVWVLFAGERLYRWSKEEVGGDIVYMEKRWVEMGGRKGYSLKRWELWRERFGEFEGRGDVDEKLREVAGEARREMERIEREWRE